MTSKEVLELDPDKIAKLPSREIPHLVTAAITLDRAIKLSQQHLGLMKDRLLEEAAADFARLSAEEGREQKSESSPEGHTFTYSDPEGQIARVSYPRKKLISSFWIEEGKALRYDSKLRRTVVIGDLQAVAGTFFKSLFQQTYRPVKTIRDLVTALLTKPDQRKLLEMIELPSSPRVSFGTAGAEEEE